jgi:putative transposase
MCRRASGTLWVPTEAVKSALALRRTYARAQIERKVSQPQSAACPPRYNLHTYRIDWQSRTVRLSLVGGRQTIRFRLLDYANKYAGDPVDTADLAQKDDEWWLHVVVSVPTPAVQPTDAVIGVDLGINRALQKKGTKSAKRHLRKTKRRRCRFRKDADHVLSKQIVAAAEPGDTIVLENLKDIRKRTKAKRRTKTKRRMHSWPFASLRAKIEYKAEERGCRVVAVDPRHTSQTCSCCGHTAAPTVVRRACSNVGSAGIISMLI